MPSLASSLLCVNAAIDAAHEDKRIVGAVTLVARGGELIYRRASGWADREAREPMREDTIFRFASITKPIVTVAAMRLAEQGVLTLDQPVTRWLPAFRPRLPDGRTPDITLHHLLTHTAGLSYRFLEPPESAYHRLDISDGLDQPGLSLAANLERLAAVRLAFAPGAQWRYSLGLDVLGAALERATGHPLPVLVTELVTAPLGMWDSAFGAVDPSRLDTPYANGKPEPARMMPDMPVPLWDGVARFAPARILNPASYASGGAGMAGTAADVLRFLETIRRGGAPILQAQTVATMMRDQVGIQAQARGPGWGFGYGWAVLGDPQLAHSPQAPGTLQWGGAFGHNWFVDPARALTVVCMTNTAFEGMIGPFTTELRDAVYADLASGLPR